MQQGKGLCVFFLTIFLSCMLSFASVVHAEKLSEINVASEAWEDSTNKDGSGLYWDIIRLVYEPQGIKVNWSTTAYARSVGLVKNKKNDAWVGSYINEEDGVLYPSAYFDADIVTALFVKKTEQPWLGESSLSGKMLAWIKGYELHEYLDVEFQKKEFNSRKNVESLLLSGRIDYYIDAQAEMNTYFGESIKAGKLHTETIKLLNLYLAFSDNERGRQLSELFDERFPKLLASGEIKQLFDKWNKAYIW